MSKNAARNPAIKSTAIKYLLALALLAFASSCGGGGGGSTITNPNYGTVDGYVYAPVGSSARVAEAAPAGYMAVSGASVSISCGGSTKNTTTNSAGYYKMTSLPTGNCSLTVTKSGYGGYQTNVSITANSTTTVGGSSGVFLTPSTSGSIKVTANVYGGEVIIDGKETNITIPSTLNYTFTDISPGNHTVSVILSGFESITPQTTIVTQGQTSEVVFTLNPTGNRAPTSDAGDDSKGFAGTQYDYEGWNGSQYIFTPVPLTIILDGTGSADPDGNALSYHWARDSGPVVELSNSNAATATFTPAEEGTYIFSLKVRDGYLESASDTVSIIVEKITGKLVFSCAYKSTGTSELCIMNADGTNLVHLTENYVNDNNPVWSPDGGRIMYTKTSYGVTLINSDGTGQFTLYQGGGYDWFPTGDHLLVNKLNHFEYFSIETDGSNEQQLTNTGLFNGFAKVSPDGSKIAFNADYGGDNFEIIVMNADGSSQTRITNNTTTEFYFAWMPDGRILYTSSNFLGDDTKHLYVMNADGSGRQEIPIPSNVVDINGPTVSSDGRFVFFSDDDGYLWVMCADGSAAMSYGLGGSNPDYHPGP